jgi:ribosomal protein S18 acetylase RimI-like enzyme
MMITAYTPDHWEDIQKVHDPARMQELTLAGLEAAFLPLTIAAEREDLFDYQLYVALDEETAVGFVAFTADELAWLYVRPDYQRRGIGRALAQFALANMEAEEKSVEVLFGNEPARNLYHSLGFTKETIVHEKCREMNLFP